MNSIVFKYHNVQTYILYCAVFIFENIALTTINGTFFLHNSIALSSHRSPRVQKGNQINCDCNNISGLCKYYFYMKLFACTCLSHASHASRCQDGANGFSIFICQNSFLPSYLYLPSGGSNLNCLVLKHVRYDLHIHPKL